MLIPNPNAVTLFTSISDSLAPDIIKSYASPMLPPGSDILLSEVPVLELEFNPPEIVPDVSVPFPKGSWFKLLLDEDRCDFFEHYLSGFFNQLATLRRI